MNFGIPLPWSTNLQTALRIKYVVIRLRLIAYNVVKRLGLHLIHLHCVFAGWLLWGFCCYSSLSLWA